MDLGLTESEGLVRQTARSFVHRVGGRAELVALQAGDVGYDPAWIPALAEAGWLGMLVPPPGGGLPATVLQTALVFEELGRGPVPGPWLASSVVAAQLIAACGTEAERAPLLQAIAAGEAIVVPTQWGPEPGVSPEAASRAFVPYAAGATHLLVDLPGPRFVVVRRDHPGVRLRRLTGWHTWAYAVELDEGARSEGTALTGSPAPGAVERALDVARAVLSAYQVGGCAALLERSVEYSATRVQFGVPIGRFQRVQDHVVRLVNALDAARWATYEAIWRLDTGREAVASICVAQALASEGYVEAANAAHEVHAGIGSDPAFGLTLFSQMSRSLYHYLGAPRWHRRRLGDLLAAEAAGAAP